MGPALLGSRTQWTIRCTWSSLCRGREWRKQKDFLEEGTSKLTQWFRLSRPQGGGWDKTKGVLAAPSTCGSCPCAIISTFLHRGGKKDKGFKEAKTACAKALWWQLWLQRDRYMTGRGRASSLSLSPHLPS